ncbi:hypothetical protein [Klebsiella pneumoniae]|uniref:hypothetical protein n=1 Tax=Klebsiella pneumoniae TaxID=573 RepID=UPI00202CF9BE|nr:hypothetical protein [Klebsiella pneumoniae]URR05103.1 hypothetical protein LT986_11360 [Klebsiella pneumoniae]
MKEYLPETASQTAGPYVHIGLAPDAAGFHIFEKNFGPVLTTADTAGERITIEGRVIDGSGTPHVNLWVVARGINIGLNTRMYFADEHEANASDPVLNLIEWEVRRKTLIAEREVRGTEVVYRFDIHLQGENETVFFDI